MLQVNIPCLGTSLVVQWLRLHTPNAEGPGSIPGQGTRSHMLQLRPGTAKKKKKKLLKKYIPCLKTLLFSTRSKISVQRSNQ